MAEGRAVEPVADPDDARITMYLGLGDHRARQVRELPGGDMAGLFMAEGQTVIARGIAAGLSLHSVLADSRNAGQVLPLVGDETPVYAASAEVLERVCGRPKLRDPIGCFVRPPPLDAVGLLSAARTIAVLEGIVNPTNMGVIARCAAGLGVDALLLDPTCADPLYRRAVRVSMGEVFAVAHARLNSFPDGLGVIGDAGFTIAALTPSGDASDLGDYRREPGDRLAIVLGTEGAGLSEPALAAAHVRLRIPMAAGVDSINVGSAAAVAFHALRDQAPS